jgi:phage tail sheath protein FI
MPIQPTYPGVYVQELPSSVHPITGVATSITAFIGRALRGPTNAPTTINSFGDFQRNFGGLWANSALGYTVQDFFMNGGSQAIIVRLFEPATAADSGIAKLSVGGLLLVATSPGIWGKNLQATTDLNILPGQSGTFNLTVAEVVNSQTVQKEVFSNLSVDQSSARRVDKILTSGSQLVNWDSSQALPNSVTAGTSTITAQGSDGQPLNQGSFALSTGQTNKQGLFALENADLFNLLCVPPYNDLVVDGGPTDIDTATLLGHLASYCVQRRAMLIVDPSTTWQNATAAVTNIPTIIEAITSTNSANAAIFFPMLMEADPMQNNQIETFVPCGAVAGVFAATDAQRGIWKAPAGTLASIAGIVGQSVPLTNTENGNLNPLGVNCLRTFPTTGTVVWGSRTLQGDDRLGSQWKYVPVRRTALFLEESLYRGLQWVVFEPNDEPLWAQIRLNVTSFMQDLFRKGAFQGATPQQAYLVKCDSETTTQTDINNGIVNILVGFAPLKPAEFVILQIEQLAGQTQS